MLYQRILSLLLIGLLVVGAGCSGRKPVQALVTLDGKAIEGATVLLSKEGAPPISGVTGPDGIVLLDSAAKDGIPPGDYKVVVTKVKAGSGNVVDPKSPDAMKMMKMGSAAAKSELPAKYDSPKSTPLTLKIPPDSVPAKIELKK